jgi:predicted ATP-binding protein involved in virulence
MYSGNKTISFSDTSIVVKDGTGVEIGLASLSSGEKHLIQLFVETLLAQESAILIDEPEISIHVHWQRELVAAFRTLNPKAQFILATHSPEVMAGVDDDKIFAL